METSFRDTVLSQIGDYLFSAAFHCSDVGTLREGILNIVNMISDYYEEGTHLYPEVVLVSDVKYFKSIPNHSYTLFNGSLDKSQFGRAVKMCAPLAVNGWNIFIEVKEDKMSWGVITSEVLETSLSMYHQISKDESTGYSVAYIRNIGFKTVEFCSLNSKEIRVISLSLHEIGKIRNTCLNDFCKIATRKCTCKKESINTYFKKMISSAFQTGHGNLLIILKDKKNLKIPSTLKEGIDLTQSPIDFVQCFEKLEDSTLANDAQTHSEMRMMSNLAVSMMNHDGITVFTDTGKIVGYHYIVDNKVEVKEVISGGARTKAYKALSNMKTIEAVMMRTQEGDIKFSSNERD